MGGVLKLFGGRTVVVFGRELCWDGRFICSMLSLWLVRGVGFGSSMTSGVGKFPFGIGSLCFFIPPYLEMPPLTPCL